MAEGRSVRGDDGRGRPSEQDTGSASGQDALALHLSALARDLQQEASSQDVLARVVRGAIDLVPGTEGGSVSLVTGRRQVTSEAASSDLARTVDALQGEVGQGPCLDAVYDQRTVRVADMATEARWPRFARRAHEAGVGAMLSFQLFVEADDLGALNLYARSAGAFDDESEHVGLLFAAHAAVAYAGAQEREHLVQGMGTRDVIGMAKGLLMERYGVDGDRAFAVLVRASQHTNRKLRDVAEELVTTRQLAGQRR